MSIFLSVRKGTIQCCHHIPAPPMDRKVLGFKPGINHTKVLVAIFFIMVAVIFCNYIVL